MKKTMLVTALSITMIGATLGLSACGDSQQNGARTHYSQVYTGSDGNVYAQSYDDNGLLIWYLLYLNSQPYSATSTPVTSASLAGTSWRPANSVPPNSGLTRTETVVETNEKGEPTSEAENASEVNADEVVDADTTADEAQADAEADAAAESSDNGSGDSSSDGSDSGASDGSGGDGGSFDGGGSDGGGFDGGGGDAGGGDAGGF